MGLLKRHKHDILLIAGVLLCALVLWAVTLLCRTPGGEVVVTRSGEEILRLSLDADTEVVLEGKGGQNTLVIRDGEAFVTHANCPDGLCIRQGAVRHRGETIVCLPHELVISVCGGTQGGVDGVSG